MQCGGAFQIASQAQHHINLFLQPFLPQAPLGQHSVRSNDIRLAKLAADSHPAMLYLLPDAMRVNYVVRLDYIAQCRCKLWMIRKRPARRPDESDRDAARR